MNIEDLHAKLISLPFVSETRVPYTYHHDYVRGYGAMSRSDVGQKYKDVPIEQIYAGAVLHLLQWNGIEMIKAFKEDIYPLTMWALDNFHIS